MTTLSRPTDVYNVNNDSSQMLKGTKYPIPSFSLFGYFGMRSSGKTTVM